MFQKMLSKASLDVSEYDLEGAEDIKVCLKQDATNFEHLCEGEDIDVDLENGVLTFTVPKAECSRLRSAYARAQVMYTQAGVPHATKIYKVEVRELLASEGYGE